MGERSDKIWHILNCLVENGIFPIQSYLEYLKSMLLEENLGKKGDCRHEWLLSQIEKNQR